MKPPSFLPSANSRKWHSRRLIDSLGYYRVRTLAKEEHQDPDGLESHLRVLRRRLEGQQLDATTAQAWRATVDHASDTVRRYRRQPTDEAWRDCIRAVDAILAFQHERELGELGFSAHK